MRRRVVFSAIAGFALAAGIATPAFAPQVGHIVVDDSGGTGGVELQPLPCPACMFPPDVVEEFGQPIYYYGQFGNALDLPNSAIVGLRTPAKTVGLYNPLRQSIEIVVTTLATGAARTYTLGPSEIVTVECENCREELEISIETSGQPPFKARFDGGTIVVPEPAAGIWRLASLGAAE